MTHVHVRIGMQGWTKQHQQWVWLCCAFQALVHSTSYFLCPASRKRRFHHPRLVIVCAPPCRCEAMNEAQYHRKAKLQFPSKGQHRKNLPNTSRTYGNMHETTSQDMSSIIHLTLKLGNVIRAFPICRGRHSCVYVLEPLKHVCIFFVCTLACTNYISVKQHVHTYPAVLMQLWGTWRTHCSL